MIFEQKWQGYATVGGKYSDCFEATVPGNIQRDYAAPANISCCCAMNRKSQCH